MGQPDRMVNTIRLSAAELELESLPQRTLTLFIIFKRADRTPSLLQMLQLGSSFLFAAKGMATNYVMWWRYEEQEDFITTPLCTKIMLIGNKYCL